MGQKKIVATDGYLGITDIIYDINDYVILSHNNKRYQIIYDDEIPYFIFNEEKNFLNEFIRI